MESNSKATYSAAIVEARARTNPAYLAYIFDLFCRNEGCSRQKLYSELNANELSVVRAALCLRPRENCFESDIDLISQRFGLNAGKLANVVRLVDAMEVGQGATTPAEEGLLLAARLRSEDEEPNEAE